MIAASLNQLPQVIRGEFCG